MLNCEQGRAAPKKHTVEVAGRDKAWLARRTRVGRGAGLFVDGVM